MRFYFGTPRWGWHMWGIGYKATWFFGFSRKTDRDAVLKYKFSDEGVANAGIQPSERSEDRLE